ncbi:N-acyl homoserine lactonase family protein [Streptomyces javensis]|uniref:N-acyl homoserine lactonase family protein n=1 Tax=Streptomyces javensis TaxID=114698 RepID=A0ABN1XBV9_9ACTN
MARGDLMAGGAGVVKIPVPVFLIEHDEGLVLVDTGLNPAAAEDAEAVYGDLMSFLLIDYRPEHTVERQLAAIGYRCSDITHVVVSHGHFDHTGGMKLFSGAHFYLGAGELDHVHADTGDQLRACRGEDFTSLDRHAWTEFEHDVDLFGDGAIEVLLVPGHTPGNAAVLVRLPTRRVLLTADTVHLRHAWEHELPMPIDHDHARARESIRRLKRIAADTRAEVWIPHDPDDWHAFGAPGVYQ